jgi:hypothetical protein
MGTLLPIMNNKKIMQSVMSNAQKSMNRSLSDLEIIFVKGQLVGFVKNKTPDQLREAFPIFMGLLIEGLKNPKSVHKAMVEPQHVDIHELLKTQIEDPDKVDAEAKNPNDITSILGMGKGMALLRAFNPLACVCTAYIILDRKFQSRAGNGIDEFTWQLSTQGQGYNANSSAISTVLPNNIIGAKIIPFRFPRTEAAVTFSKRLSISIKELDMHSYVASDHRRRFHFMFTLIESTAGGPNDPYVLANSGGEATTEFWLGSAVSEINSITLTFGNPFTQLRLDPDRLPVTITSVGVQTLLTFTQPHFMSIGDTLTVEDFTTSNPTADFVDIELMSDETGWPAVVATATTLTINVDISGLIGVITTPTSVYLESKRFLIPLEIKYMAD